MGSSGEQGYAQDVLAYTGADLGLMVIAAIILMAVAATIFIVTRERAR